MKSKGRDYLFYLEDMLESFAYILLASNLRASSGTNITLSCRFLAL